MKLIYQYGVSHSKNKSKLNRLLAIHNCHYAVEQILRERGKNLSFSNEALHKINFEEVIKKLNQRQTIPYYDRLVELNKIRNNAEHSFILTDPETVRLYVGIVEDFLKWSYKNYFDVDYTSLAFEDDIIDDPIRRVMLVSKEAIEKGDFPTASSKMYEALGAFKFMWFGFLLDARIDGFKSETEYSLAEGFADFAFKIILSEDETTLEAFSKIKTTFKKQDGKINRIVSEYLVPSTFQNKEEALSKYEEILNIILSYQDKIPFSRWRKKKATDESTV